MTHPFQQLPHAMLPHHTLILSRTPSHIFHHVKGDTRHEEIPGDSRTASLSLPYLCRPLLLSPHKLQHTYSSAPFRNECSVRLSDSSSNMESNLSNRGTTISEACQHCHLAIELIDPGRVYRYFPLHHMPQTLGQDAAPQSPDDASSGMRRF